MARKLMIGYDGSERGEDALALGSVLADCLAAKPLIANVLPRRAYPLGDSEELEGAIESEPIFAAARTRLGRRDVATRALTDPSPARGLYHLAENEQPLTVVIGSAHRGALGRVLLGSVGAALLSGGPCAIAVAPRGYAGRAPRRVSHVGVAFNGADESWTALDTAISLAGRLDGSVTIVAVVDPLTLDYAAAYPIRHTIAYQPDAERDLDRALRRALDRVPPGLPVERRQMTGDPAALIGEAAAEFDLLILGSRGYGPIRRALLGAVSAKLMQTAPCPVLVLPRGVGEDPLQLRGVARVIDDAGA